MNQLQETRSSLKRPRPVLSCLECRRKKLKCDRFLPCQQCLKINQPSGCVYAPGQEPEIRDGSRITASLTKRARNDSAETARPRTDPDPDLHERVKRLEEALRAQQTPQSPSQSQNGFSTPSAAQQTPRENLSHNEVPSASCSPPIADDKFSISKVFEDVQRFSNSIRQRQHDPEIRTIARQLLAIQHAAPTRSKPKLVASTTFISLQDLISRMIRMLPERQVQDKLITLYFSNFEHCGRILHKTQFIRQHQQFGLGMLQKRLVEYFIPALLGVFCVVSTMNTYPECELPELKGGSDGFDALQLLYKWYELVIENDGPTMNAIQVRLLALLAQKYRNAEPAGLWVSSGQLVRQAMVLRLHEEPPPTTNNHEAEIRRCLWLTILEQDLALAISCEKPPLCPPYNLRSPFNCDDDELSDTTSRDPPRHSTDKWTDGLCQHILGTTFNQRLEAYGHRFTQKSASHYAKTLEHARGLELILRNLPPLFRLDHMADHAANTPGRLMAQMDLDICLRRPMSASYAPYARPHPSQRIYQEARIPWVQSHLIVLCFQDLFDPQFPTIDVPRPVGYWDFYFTAYHHDIIEALETELLEAHYLKLVESTPPGQRKNQNETSTAESPARFMRWNFAAMIKSIEDTFNPMTRRIGSSGGDLRTLVRYTMMYDSLITPINENSEPYILDGLKRLIGNLRPRLEREGLMNSLNHEQYASDNDNLEWLANFLGAEE